MPRRHRLLIPLALTLVALAPLTGCEIERSTSTRRGIPLRSGPVAPLQLPQGPLAQPTDPAASTSSQAKVEMLPLGQVAYDGLTLPLVSPDGRWLAAQVGSPPSDAAILGLPGALMPADSKILIYDLTARPLSLVAEVREPGLRLGRSADATGFLVESPTPDGTRRLGFVSWRSAEVRWIVSDDWCNAHAILLTDGAIAYSRRPIESGEKHNSQLVVRTSQGDDFVFADPTVDLVFPAAAADPAVLAVLGADDAGRAVAITVQRENAQSLRRTGQLDLGPGGLPTAYQAIVGAQPAPTDAAADDPMRAVVLMFNPLAGGIVLLDASAGKSLGSFRGTIGAAFVPVAQPPSMVRPERPTLELVLSGPNGLQAATPGRSDQGLFRGGVRTLLEGSSTVVPLITGSTLAAMLPSPSSTAPRLRIIRILIGEQNPIIQLPGTGNEGRVR